MQTHLKQFRKNGKETSFIYSLADSLVNSFELNANINLCVIRWPTIISTFKSKVSMLILAN